jgi:DNA polymerase-3 subunit delta
VPKADGETRVLLLHGEERFSVEEEARSTLARWQSELISDFGFETLDGAGLTAGRLRDAILQAPFLDPFRAVAVRWVPGAKAEGLASALDEVPQSTRLLITVAGRLGATNKLVKAVTAAKGTVREHARLKGRALSDWAASRAKHHGLPANLAAQVVRVTPADLAIIDSELVKMAAYKASGAHLTSQVINELLAGGREDEIFKLTDQLLPRPTPEAWSIVRSLARSGMQPTSVAYRMARHIALVVEVRARQDRGQSLSEIQAEMSEHSFVIQKAYERARDVNPNRLEGALSLIRDYEFEVKSGQVDAELGLDVLLARL